MIVLVVAPGLLVTSRPSAWLLIIITSTLALHLSSRPAR